MDTVPIYIPDIFKDLVRHTPANLMRVYGPNCFNATKLCFEDDEIRFMPKEEMEEWRNEKLYIASEFAPGVVKLFWDGGLVHSAVCVNPDRDLWFHKPGWTSPYTISEGNSLFLHYGINFESLEYIGRHKRKLFKILYPLNLVR